MKGAKKKNALLIYTLSDSDLRQRTRRMCELSGLDSVDLMGPLLDELSAFFGEAPMGTPGGELSKRGDGAGFKLTDSYYRRIEAVEFTLKADDGSAPWLLADADVVLCGVSRTGKTPLSVVLAQQMGLKVANVPLVMEVSWGKGGGGVFAGTRGTAGNSPATRLPTNDARNRAGKTSQGAVRG